MKNLSQYFIVFLLCLSGFSCPDKTEIIMDVPDPEPPTFEAGKIHYLALGDSYTIGEGVEISDRWPNQLTQQLSAQGFEVGQKRIIAQTGWTTSNLLNAFEVNELLDYNLVSLLIGVNNQFQNLPFEQFQEQFNLLLNQSIEIAGNLDRVFVVSIPDYGVTPFGSNNSAEIAEEIDAYNTFMKSSCDSLLIPFIDVTEISRELAFTSGALVEDDLHPSASQYQKWVEVILPEVINLLE